MRAPISIYRLENCYGSGPFEDAEQNIIKYLSQHKDPESMLSHTNTEINFKVFNALMKRNYKFGWINEEFYKSFFISNNRINTEMKVYSQGMRKKIYTATDYYCFEDGQVIFNPESPCIDITPVKKSK